MTLPPADEAVGDPLDPRPPESAASPPSRTDGERLQRVLARAGLGSRRACEDLIRDGRVAVNDVVAILGGRVDAAVDRVTLDGIPVIVRDDLVYYLLNKPVGVVTTARDPQGRPTVLDLVPREPRVFPVGRLDLDTEGLLLLTNDGDLAQRLAHPSGEVDKTYTAEVEGIPGRLALGTLREGVMLEDGVTSAARVKVLARHGGRAVIEVTVHEGRNRQIRRMCAAVGHPVSRLARTRYAGLRAENLPPGSWRALDPAEVRGLYAASHG